MGSKVPSDYRSKDIYKLYKATADDPVDFMIFMRILSRFNLYLVKLLYNGFIFKIPNGLGNLLIIKKKLQHVFDDEGNYNYKKSRACTDWGETNKLWKAHPKLKHKKYIVYENEHTNGFSFKFKWSLRGHNNVKYVRWYAFKPTRTTSRGLATYVRENPNTDYYQIN